VGLIGVIDESTPTLSSGEVLYGLSMVLVESSQLAIVESDLKTRLGRKNPFHWESDKGPVVRAKVLDPMKYHKLELCLSALACIPSSANMARKHLLETQLLPLAKELSVAELLIETRSASENSREVALIRSWYRQKRSPMPTISHELKARPITWSADAAAGLWTDFLLSRSPGHLDALLHGSCVTKCYWSRLQH
jgi:hypothetical protein